MAFPGRRGTGLGLHHGADLGAHLGQCAHVLGVEAGELLADAVGQAVMGQKCAEGMRRGGKPVGTRTPSAAAKSSRREAFLPPTDSTSVILRFSNGTTRAVALEQCRHGKAPEVETGSAPMPWRSSGEQPGAGLGIVVVGCGRRAWSEIWIMGAIVGPPTGNGLTYSRPHAHCTVFLSPTAPASLPKPLVTPSWPSSNWRRATCACPSSTPRTRPTRRCARSTTRPKSKGARASCSPPW